MSYIFHFIYSQERLFEDSSTEMFYPVKCCNDVVSHNYNELWSKSLHQHFYFHESVPPDEMYSCICLRSQAITSSRLEVLLVSHCYILCSKCFWRWKCFETDSPGEVRDVEMTRLYEYSDSDWHFSKDRLWSTKHKTSNTRGLFRIIHHVRLRISFLSGSHYHVLATLQCNKYISNLVAPWIGWVRYDKSLLI